MTTLEGATPFLWDPADPAQAAEAFGLTGDLAERREQLAAKIAEGTVQGIDGALADSLRRAGLLD